MNSEPTSTDTTERISELYDLQEAIREVVRNDTGEILKEIEPDGLYLNAISALDLIDDTATAFGIWQDNRNMAEGDHFDYIFIHRFMQCL